ncbi:hypothetical protein FSW04_07395 [Baekduia soli]|uniref:Uncharacterized protein n=1 Tax=Baekduia soli TaxID=496014 RepID=A0A5B8U399_9ACTN|nr:hypothetical protein [Baekduia soli]QEC47422.1 hypothetical protein FSW04_07395 [Baekduia soli]
MQEIVTGSLAGEEHLIVVVVADATNIARLIDGDQRVVARVVRHADPSTAERVGLPRGGGYAVGVAVTCQPRPRLAVPRAAVVRMTFARARLPTPSSGITRAARPSRLMPSWR